MRGPQAFWRRGWAVRESFAAASQAQDKAFQVLFVILI